MLTSQENRRHSPADGALLALLLLVALSLRLMDLNWDAGHFAHPDERFIVMVTQTVEWPKRWQDLFNPRQSGLNPFSRPDGSGVRQPEHFAYGHFPVYLLKGITSGLQALWRPAAHLFGAGSGVALFLRRMTDFTQMTMTGRVLSALFDTASIVVAYAFGRRLFGRWAGLLAAGLLVFTVMDIQLAHFYAVDSLLAFFVTLTLYWLVRYVQDGERKAALWAGAAFALAVASKSSAAPLALPWAAAFLLRERRRAGGQSQRGSAGDMLASAAVGAVTFALVSPYVLLDLKMFLSSVGFEGQMVRGVVDLPYTRQYRNTPAFLYPVLMQLRWGMGWLPGLLAFAGLLWATARQGWRAWERQPLEPETIVLAWALPYFLITGSFMVKFMRYMAPLIPVMLVLGSGLIVHLGRRWRRLAIGAAVLVLLYAVLWSAAFTSIYRRPFTREAASQWIYRNIPAGEVITTEEWDDLIPYPTIVDGTYRSPEQYTVVSFPLQEPDDLRKVDMLVRNLTEADYVIVSSNRFYGWLPRMRSTYPLSNAYYEMLFKGQLGFELVQQFTSYPTLGPWQFRDDHADESFTVYDHPKVMIFKKTQPLPPEQLRAMFISALGSGAQAGGDRSLLLPVALDRMPIRGDFGWNAWATDGLPAIVFWWLVATILGLAAWPLLHWLVGDLWAGGWPLSRVLGLLLVGYATWLPSSLGLPANRAILMACAALLLLFVAVLVSRRRASALAAFLRGHWRELVAAEAIALVAYLAWTGVRVLNPDLWHPWWGGERPMEMGFLLGILKSGRFPPYDPFYAGGYINYYYYGLYLVSCLVKLTGIVPEVAFNLALAYFYSLTVAAAATLGASLARHHKATVGLCAAAFVGLIGNVDGGLQLVRRWGEQGTQALGANLPLLGWLPRLLLGLYRVIAQAAPVPNYDFWGPTRVIPDTINEFPFFSFLYGDLHPHILDMPVVLFGLALAYSLLRRLTANENRRAELSPSPLASVTTVALLAFLAGGAIATNTWDAPLLLAGLALVALLAWRGRSWRELRFLAGVLLMGGVAAVVLFLPFLTYYKAPPGGLGLTRAGSPLLHFLRIWGFFALASLGMSLLTLARARSTRGVPGFISLALRHWRRLPQVLDLAEAFPGARRAASLANLGLLLFLLLMALLIALGRAAAGVCLSLGLIAALAAWAAPSPEERFASGLAAVAWAVLLAAEVFYLKDWLAGGPAYRMNTVFKFGVQAWLLLGVSCGAQALLLWRPQGGLASVWRGATLALLALCSLYPLLGGAARISARFPNAHPPVGTLNGLAYMSVGSYFWPDEQHPIVLLPESEALAWLRQHVPGAPVVAEAALGYYREGGSAVASWTGLPIPLGPQHEAEQRPQAPLGERESEVRELYQTPDPAQAERLIKELSVSYIYVGQLERIAYGDVGLAKFETMVQAGQLERAYSNQAVSIYRVR